MKYQLVFIFFLILLSNILPQTNHSSILYWNEKKINWDDFNGIPLEKSDDSSELNFTIGYQIFEKPMNNTKIKWIEAYSYMFKSSSWVKEEHKTDQLLIYNQTIFDIVELYSRKFQREINGLSEPTYYIIQRVGEFLKFVTEECRRQISHFRSDAEKGLNYRKILFWSTKIKNELLKYPQNILPNYTISNWGFGFTYDMGYGMLTNKSSDFFSNNFNLAFGFDIGYQPMMFYLRGILGFNSVKKPFEYENRIWRDYFKTGLAIIELSSGTSVYESRKFNITPFAGGGIIEFARRLNEKKETNEYRFYKFTPILGINIDYIFSRKLNFIEYFLFREKSNWLIRTRFTCVPFDFANNIKGWSFNLTVGIGSFINIVNL